MEKLIEKSSKEFTSLLASASPAPGGGGAAALAAALGLALGEMVGSLTLGKSAYANGEADIRHAMDELRRLRQRALELVQDDGEGFLPLAEAYKLPKDEPKRSEIIESATLKACQAPMEIVELGCEAMEHISVMAEKGSRQAISDAGCAATLIKAAIDAAALNVYINTKTMNDRASAAELNQRCMEAQVHYGAIAQQIYSVVMAKLIN